MSEHELPQHESNERPVRFGKRVLKGISHFFADNGVRSYWESPMLEDPRGYRNMTPEALREADAVLARMSGDTQTRSN